MSNIKIMLISIGVSMDAFSVALSNGIKSSSLSSNYVIKVSLFFSVAQFIMPIIGYFFGTLFGSFIDGYGKIIASLILITLGIKPLIKKSEKNKNNTSNTSLLLQSIATSMDALIIGISLSIINTNIFTVSFSMGITTFIVCFFGVIIGKNFNKFFYDKAESVGGIILIIIGLSILK